MQTKTLQTKRALRTALLVMLLGAAGMGKGYASYDFSAVCETGQMLYYNITDADNHYVELTCPGNPLDGYSWLGFTQPTGNIILPETVQFGNITYTVTSIGNCCFYACTGLTGSIIIPSSVTIIGVKAFAGCKGFSGTLTLPNYVIEIGESAFNSCSNLTGTLVLPESLIRIGDGAFYYCNSFTGELNIPNTVTEIGVMTFGYCTSLTGELIIPNSVTTLGTKAFYNCPGFVGNLILPGSLLSIGDEAFFDCRGLTGNLVIPRSVVAIGNNPFAGTNLDAISVEPGNLIYDSRENCNAIIKTDNNTLVFGCKNSFIPNSVTAIGDCAFEGSGLAGELNLPNSLVTIGDGAFFRCNFTGDLVIPNSVTHIGVGAFSESGFTGKLTISNSIDTIKSCTFSSCGFTGELIIPNSVTTIESGAFSLSGSFTGDLVIPHSVVTIDRQAFMHCGGFTGNLIIGNSVTTIGDQAFYGCTRFSGNLIFPESLVALGEEAFAECRSFTGNLYIPNSLVELGKNPFAGTKFDKINVEPGHPKYDSRENCNAIIETNTNTLIFGCKNTVVPNTVTAIGDKAFFNCSELTGTLFIPNAITTIGEEAFSGCSGIEAVIVESENPTYDSRENCNAIIETNTNTLIFGCKNSFIPNSIHVIGPMAFYYCKDLLCLRLPNSLTKISGSAFTHCEGLTGNLIVPSSVTQIDGTAFLGCNNLNGVVMCSAIPPTIGTWCFMYTDIQIYVPYESLDLYKTAPNWNYEAAYIHPISKVIHGYGNGSVKWNFIASPTSANTAPIDVDDMISGTDDTYSLYRFNQGGQVEWEDYQGHNSYTNPFYLVNGQGYLYASQEDAYLVFKGAYNDDESKTVPLDYNIGANYQGWNLVGNPFMDNTFIDRSYYLMNDEGNNIVPYAVSTETSIEPFVGIMVQATDSDQSITFSKNPPQVTNNGMIRIEVFTTDTLNSMLDRAIISFNEEDQLKKFVFNDQFTQLYISKENEDFAIIYSNQQTEQQLNFKVMQNDSFTLRVYPTNVEISYLHLIDNILNVDVDLLMTPEYTFEGKTTDNASRFRLVFKAGNGIDENESAPFAFFSNGRIIIADTEGTAILQVIDMQGRILISETVNGAYDKQLNLTNGVYLIRLNDRAQKIVVR